MQVTIYSTTTCPYCKLLKDYLNQKKVIFAEKMVDLDENAKEEISKLSGGFLGVPLTHIVLDDGRSETVIGFDKEKIDQVIGQSIT